MGDPGNILKDDTIPLPFDEVEPPRRFFFVPRSKRKLAVLLIYMIGFSEGLLYLSNLGIYYLFKDDFGLSPAQLSLVYSIPALPYVIRPIMAYLTDVVPILGTRRKYYLILNSLVQSLSFFFLGLFNLSLASSVVALFFISFTLAFCMTIAEALVVENITDGTDNLSGFVSTKAFSSLLVSYFSGAMLEKYPKQRLFFVTGFFPLVITFYAYFMKEEQQTIVYESHPIKDLFKFLREPQIFHPSVYLFLVCVSPEYEGSFLYYIIDVLGYSPSFMGVLRLVYGSSVIIGIGIYRSFFKNSPIKKIYFWSSLIANIIYLLPVIITTNLHLKLGIPDKPLVLCSGFLMEAVFEIQVMPFLTYSTRVTPKGLEASVFAAIMTIKSVGIVLCKILSSFFTFLFGIDVYKYDNLSYFIVFDTFLLFVIMLQLIKVPNKEEMDLLVTRQKMLVIQDSNA